MKNTIGVIGAGNMGGALFTALRAGGFSCLVYDRDYAKARRVGKANAAPSLATLITKSSSLIIAVKPQSFVELAGELRGTATNKLLISIMAGISLKKITALTGAKKAVRAMPNLACLVNSGITGWVCSRAVTKPEKSLVKNIFARSGLSLELPRESMVDTMTTVSSCGLAYFYYLTELMAVEAKKFGFSEAVANEIAAAAFVGAAKLLEQNAQTPQQWRAATTSKGGMTEAALAELQRKHFPAIFSSALKKAAARARVLNK